MLPSLPIKRNPKDISSTEVPKRNSSDEVIEVQNKAIHFSHINLHTLKSHTFPQSPFGLFYSDEISSNNLTFFATSFLVQFFCP